MTGKSLWESRDSRNLDSGSYSGARVQTFGEGRQGLIGSYFTKFALPACLALMASCSSSGSSDFTAPEQGDSASQVVESGSVVAVMETEAPKRQSFILRGTVPVPPGTLTEDMDKVPLSVLNWDGSTAPTQVEKVSSYAKDADGADVVEILARVETPPSAAPGSRLTYQVIVNEHDAPKQKVTYEAHKLLVVPEAMKLVGHDVHGNRYQATLFKDGRRKYAAGTADVFREGAVALQIATHDTMVPDKPSDVGKPKGPLSHLLGVHSYHTVWTEEDSVSVDLRIHNAHSGHNKLDPRDDPLGEVFFSELELWVPEDWKVFQQNPDPGLGAPYSQAGHTVYPLLAKRGDGKMHFMPTQAQFNRRLVFAPNGQEAAAQAILDEEGRAFCKQGVAPDGSALWSWWNTDTARYFPQRNRLPELDFLGAANLREEHHEDLAFMRNLIATGGGASFPQATPRLGWAHPWGVPYGGMTGGSEIFQYEGVETAFAGSLDGYRYAQLTHRMYSDRMPDALYNIDGKPTKFEDWVVQGQFGPYLPMIFSQKLKGSSDPFGFDKADTSHQNFVKSNGLAPPYQAELAKFAPIDFQHLSRYTRSAKALAWLGNDALAKDDLRMHAELFRMTYCMLPNGEYGYAAPSGMLSDTLAVEEFPGKGFAFGRGEGWGLDCANAAYSLGTDDWRQLTKPWFEDVVDLASAGQSSCNGFIQSLVSAKMIDGKYRVRQAIEQGICENALRGSVESVFRNVDNARTKQTEFTLEQSFYAMIGPMAWNNALNGPHSYLAVGPIDQTQGTFCGSIPSDGGDNGVNFGQAYSSFAYAYQMTGDETFIQKASACLGASGPAGLISTLENSGKKDLENRTALIALCQELGF